MAYMSLEFIHPSERRKPQLTAASGIVLVRLASPDDQEAIWRIMEPIIRAGETYPLPSDMSKADALAIQRVLRCASSRSLLD